MALVSLPTDINVKDDLLLMANQLAMLEVSCMEICRATRMQQKELIKEKLGYKTSREFRRDSAIFKTIRQAFIDTLMRTPKKKGSGSGTYKRSTAEQQWKRFMSECYEVSKTVNNKGVIEQLSDEER